MQRLEERSSSRIGRIITGVQGVRELAHDFRHNRRLNRDYNYHLGNERTTTALNRFSREWHPARFSEELYDSFRERPLSPEALKVFIVIGIVETNSFIQGANAAAGGIEEHPKLRYFLRTWRGEEAEHGYIFERIAAESMGHRTSKGRLIDRDLFKDYKPKPSFAQRHSQELVALTAEATNCFPAIYATFGAVQEQSVIRAYELLKKRINDERIDLVLDEIISQEKRHFRTYFEWAKYYLGTDPLAQRIVRKGLQKLWKPVGFDAMGAGNWEELYDYLCPTEADRDYFKDVDRVVQLLPGMEGLTVMTDAMTKLKQPKKKQLVAA